MNAQIRTVINTWLDVDYEMELAGFILHSYIDANGTPDPNAWTVTHKFSGIAVGYYMSHDLALMALNYFSETEIGGIPLGKMQTCEVLTVAPLLSADLPDHIRTDYSTFAYTAITPEIKAVLCP